LATRFRDLKKKKPASKPASSETTATIKAVALTTRIKAFITDMFMLMMPLLYITTYLILDGKDDFQNSDMTRWIVMGIFGLIIIIFWVKAGQTPGMKAYSIKVVNQKNEQNLTFGVALLRYILFILTMVTVILMYVPFFRKDRRTLYDLLTKTKIITTQD
jgi:uncharacterized RDD family membrane protein YckC